jgi:hypothetical protein
MWLVLVQTVVVVRLCGCQQVASISLNWGFTMKIFNSIPEVPGQLATVLQHAGKAQMTELQTTELQTTNYKPLNYKPLNYKPLNYKSND